MPPDWAGAGVGAAALGAGAGALGAAAGALWGELLPNMPPPLLLDGEPPREPPPLDPPLGISKILFLFLYKLIITNYFKYPSPPYLYTRK